jgi:hypothetical protein
MLYLHVCDDFFGKRKHCLKNVNPKNQNKTFWDFYIKNLFSVHNKTNKRSATNFYWKENKFFQNIRKYIFFDKKLIPNQKIRFVEFTELFLPKSKTNFLFPSVKTSRSTREFVDLITIKCILCFSFMMKGSKLKKHPKTGSQHTE